MIPFLKKLVFFTLILVIYAGCRPVPAVPPVTRGQVDLRKMDPASFFVLLRGQWNFSWLKFEDPEKRDSYPLKADVPGNWNRQGFPADGYGSYSLDILLPEKATSVAFRMGEVGCAYRLFVNGQLLCEKGQVGSTRETYRPETIPEICLMESPGPELHVVLHATNFDYAKGGIWHPVIFGDAKTVLERSMLSGGLQLALLTTLGVFGMLHLVLFSVYRRGRIFLYLGLSCMVLMIRESVVGEKFLLHLVSLPWGVYIRMEYFGLIFAVPFFAFYFKSLYGEAYSSLYPKILLGVAAVYSLFILVFPPRVFTGTVQFYQANLVGLMGYSLYITIKRIISGSREARYILAAGSVMILTAINDILSSNSILHTPNLISSGQVIFIFSQGAVLAIRILEAERRTMTLSGELLEKNNALGEINKSLKEKSDLFQDASVEINSSIGLLHGWLEYSYNRKLPPDQDSIHDMLLGLRKMIRQFRLLRDLYNVESKKALNLRTIDFRQLLQSIDRVVPDYLRSRNVHFRTEIAGELPPVECDPEKIYRCIFNFLSNAVKFTPAGGSIVLRGFVESGNVCVEVENSGPHISESLSKRIYFGAASSATLARSSAQPGLGLLFVRQYVRMHGGDVGYRDGEGGPVFFFTLPSSNKAGSELAAEEGVESARIELAPILAYEAAQSEQVIDAPEKGPAPIVLAVDDDPFLLQLMNKILTREGYRFFARTDGMSALNDLSTIRPDLIMLDLMLPRMNGMEIAEKIRSESDWRTVPIIMFTAMSEVETKQKAYRTGVDAFLEKPFDTGEFTSIVRNLISLKSREKAISMELDHARRIQFGLLPTVLPTLPGIKLKAVYLPMEKVGGDLYDLIPMKGGLAVFVGDVSGHGIPAAMLAAMIKMLISHFPESDKTPAAFLEGINRDLYGKTADNFLTCVLGVLSEDGREFVFANGGHPAFIQLREGKGSWHKTHGRILGCLSDVDVENGRVELQKGDRLILFTDGFVEAMDAKKNPFGEEKFMALNERYSSMPLEEHLGSLVAEIYDYQASDDFQDDLTLVGIEVE